MNNFEILLQEGETITLARVLLQCDAPSRKYPQFGIWCYFINTSTSLTIFDPGPLYNSLTRLFFRSWIKKTNNVDTVMECLRQNFPNQRNIQILLSHYHFDHSEAAPLLQQKIRRELGILAPIRIHEKDYGRKRFMLIIKTGLKDIYRKAGFKEWEMGDFAKDEELIGDSDFKIMHVPGHTSGNISIVNGRHKIAICGTEIQDLKDPIVKFIHEVFTHEDKKSLPMSVKKMKSINYKIYFLHPVLGYLK